MDERKNLLIYSQMDICSPETGVWVTYTALALKTKISHKVIDLLELSLESWKFIWKRIELFTRDRATMS